jgi:MvaI/BcnI restriction endonuclease family
MSNNQKEFDSLGELSNSFRNLGCDELIIKFLSPNQDNEKNQIYLGPRLAIAQYFPGTLELRSASESQKKPHSNSGSAIVSLSLDFYWVWPNQNPNPAPAAKMIEYSQYPEVRFSGFLQNSPNSPRALRRAEQDFFGQRVLVLGIAGDKTYGTVVTQRNASGLLDKLDVQPAWPLQGLLRRLKLSNAQTVLDSDALISELKGITKTIHEPRKLKRLGQPVEYIPVGGQAGGWTLEALLGIPMNAKSAPDKYGFEIKAVGGDRTSLITTEPDFGYRSEEGIEAYLAKFGRQARASATSRVFSGVHRCNVLNKATGAMLTIENWDFTTNSPTGEGQPNIALVHQDTGKIISGWTFAKIGASWSKKHAGAIFVQSTAVRGESSSGYAYGPLAYLGIGTSALRFVAQVANGTIFLDPGDSQKIGSSPHARTQWRISGNIKSQLPKRLEPLYDTLTAEELF